MKVKNKMRKELERHWKCWFSPDYPTHCCKAPVTATTCVRSDNPVLRTYSCSEAIIARWQLSFPLPIASSPPEELQMYHPIRDVFCWPSVLTANSGRRDAQIYSTVVHRWHTVQMFQRQSTSQQALSIL